MGERISPVATRVNSRLVNREDRYVEEALRSYGNIGFKVKDEELRQDYRSAAEAVKSVGAEHLHGLQRLLTLLVKRYTETAWQKLDTKPEQMGFPELTRSPNFDVLVNELDATDEPLSNEHIQEVIRKVNFDTRSINNFETFYYVLEHISRNATDLTDENIVFGESRSMRELSIRMQEFFHNADEEKPPREQTRATFLRSLGLARRPEILWGQVYSNKNAGHEPWFNPNESLPIGEYGEAFTARLFRTMQYMQDYTLLVQNEASQITEKNPEIFAKTARGRNDSRFGAWLALQEGNVSLMQAMYHLTAEIIDGYDDPALLVHDLIKAQLPNQIAQIAPAGTIGPIALIGKNIHGLVQKTETGELVLNSEVMKKMIERKREEITRKVMDYHFIRPEYQHGLPALGYGCPVSHKGKALDTTGIQEISYLFLDIFKRIK